MGDDPNFWTEFRSLREQYGWKIALALLAIVGAGFFLYLLWPLFSENVKLWVGSICLGVFVISVVAITFTIKKRGGARLTLASLPKQWMITCLSKLDYIENDSCIVLHQVDPKEYSNVALEIAKKPHIQTIFTVCGYEPFELVEETRRRRRIPPATAVTAAEVWKAFGHFEAFDKIAKDRAGGVIRILLIKGDRVQWLSRNAQFLSLIAESNGANVKAFVSECETLRAEFHKQDFLTDHVVFNADSKEPFCIDYYADSHTAIITLCDGDGACTEIAKLPAHFKTHSDSAEIYAPLAAFVAAHKKP